MKRIFLVMFLFLSSCASEKKSEARIYPFESGLRRACSTCFGITPGRRLLIVPLNSCSSCVKETIKIISEKGQCLQRRLQIIVTNINKNSNATISRNEIPNLPGIYVDTSSCMNAFALDAYTILLIEQKNDRYYYQYVTQSNLDKITFLCE